MLNSPRMHLYVMLHYVTLCYILQYISTRCKCAQNHGRENLRHGHRTVVSVFNQPLLLQKTLLKGNIEGKCLYDFSPDFVVSTGFCKAKTITVIGTI